VFCKKNRPHSDYGGHFRSSDTVQENKLSAFIKLVKNIENSEAICVSQEKVAKKIGNIKVLPWMDALRQYFTSERKDKASQDTIG
jgi:hypothetical protein